jgi:hypothetical protein
MPTNRRNDEESEKKEAETFGHERRDADQSEKAKQRRDNSQGEEKISEVQHETAFATLEPRQSTCIYPKLLPRSILEI